ncbi:MAG: peptidylprolyl isomerase [Paracoccaceae bacterium]
MLKPAAALAALALSLAFGGFAFAEEPNGDTVVAKVNDTEITLGDMIAVRETLPAQYLQLPDDALFTGILDQIIQQTALAAEAEEHLTKRDELMMENQKRGYLAGVTLDAVAEAAVSDEELQSLYDEKYANVELGKEYNAAHILVETEEEAKAVKADLEGGADFAAIAKEKSTDRGSAAGGGDLGWFGLGMMVKPFEEAVVALEPGAISDPVQSQFGWHIIKLNEVRTATAPTLDDAREELAGDLRQKAVEAKVAGLTEGENVQKMVEGIDPAIIKNVDLIAN